MIVCIIYQIHLLFFLYDFFVCFIEGDKLLVLLLILMLLLMEILLLSISFDIEYKSRTQINF